MKVSGVADEKWVNWKRKRRNTLICFVLIGTVVGIDSSIIYSTLYPYLKNLVKTDQPNLYYGFIYALFYISSTIFATVFGRWLDKTRRVRAYINCTLTAQVVGFVLYAIPYHPVYLLVGRFICGIGDPFISVVAGEIFRIYTDKESNHAILWLASTYSFGFIIGPSLNYFFTGIHFKVGRLEVRNYNFIGIFMASVLFLLMVVSNFLAHDCSAEFDLKDFMRRRTKIEGKDGMSGNEIPESDICADTPQKGDEIDITEDSPLLSTSQNGDIPIKSVFGTFFSNIDIVLIFLSTFSLMYTIMSACILLPLLVLEKLKWSEKSLSIIYAAYGVGDLILLTAMAKYCISNRSIYYTGLVSILTQILMYCLLLSFSLIQREIKRDVIIMAIFMVCLVIGFSFDDVIIRVMLANMVPSSIQSFSEGMRAGLSKLGIIIAALTTPLLLPWLQYWSTGIIILTCSTFLCFVARRKQLISPREASFVK